MVEALAHRGPDGEGVWVDHDRGVGLGHRRLSILELSALGHQPMMSHCGRFVIAFNGEIYNHSELRQQLNRDDPSIVWRGSSDTEVFLEAIARWGMERALEAQNGMFAIAVWDRRDAVLHLARDRFGEKPLFYGWAEGSFVFGSELKALRRFPGFRGEIDRSSLAEYLRYNYVPSPQSIVEDAFKLEPGHWLEVRSSVRAAAVPRAYWRPADVAGPAATRDRTDREWVAELNTVLAEAVRLRTLADVPVGAFLSGGIDSSLVVALMQEQSRLPVRTFTIGFEDSRYDESRFAVEVARALHTEHTALEVTSNQLRDVIPELPRMFDEPFADSSQMPTHLVARLARGHVKVALSGDGGDELFGGYARYAAARQLWSVGGMAPRRVRVAIARLLGGAPPQVWEGLLKFSRWKSVRLPGDKIQKALAALSAAHPARGYLSLVSLWHDPPLSATAKAAVREGVANIARADLVADAKHDVTDQMMLIDTLTYLPDDILQKVDRASMAVALEARVPMLDRHVFDFAWGLPREQKVRHGVGKWLLKQLLYTKLPRELLDRPKAGFAIPIGDWLRGPLRDWADDLLDPRKLRRDDLLDAATIGRVWSEHRSGKRDWQHHVWNILILQAWIETWGVR